MKKLFLLLSALISFSFVGAVEDGVTAGDDKKQIIMPGEESRKDAIKFDYFPHRQYTFVWRNWSVVEKSRLAQVLHTSVANVEELATSMGLKRTQHIEPEWATTRGYITILKRNWHLLPYDQLLQLLDMSREELKFRLVEDDFLFTKLGKVKPYCEPLIYVEPTAQMLERATQIAQTVTSFGEDVLACEDPRFGFMREFEQVRSIKPTKNLPSTEGGFELRMIYPFFADFGDPLLDEELGSYPEELMRRLQEMGVNALWLHSVMRTLVEPDEYDFPGDKKASERIKGLNRLVERAAKYGIKIFLYVNEPRAMDSDYFEISEQRQKYMGPKYNGLNSFCCSNPEVLAWLSRSMEKIFTQVKGLGGVFTITASENHTSCASRNYRDCSLCSKREYSDLIADVNRAIELGVHRASPDAKVIVWDWGWPDAECEAIISKLPKECWFMSVSEWSKPIEKGGVKSAVGEYSISNVGPGPRARRNWAAARANGLKCVAKVQVNCSWEMAVVPQVPVLDLVAQHASNIKEQNVDGVMLSWSLGGYPSQSLKLFQSISSDMSATQAVEKLAFEEYGKKAGPLIREAWRCCSQGYQEYPYHIQTLYFSPHHSGPSNIFYLEPTGYHATMVYGFAYDNWEKWVGAYPVDIWITQFEKCAKGFEQGVSLLKEALRTASKKYRNGVQTQLNRAEAVRIHLQSTTEQGRFFAARDMYLNSADESVRSECLRTMRKACLMEQELIREMLPILSQDSSIAFESANQYFYLPCDLIEAYISIDYVLMWIESRK